MQSLKKKSAAHINFNSPGSVEVRNTIIGGGGHNFYPEEHACKQVDTERGHSKQSQDFEHG